MANGGYHIVDLSSVKNIVIGENGKINGQNYAQFDLDISIGRKMLEAHKNNKPILFSELLMTYENITYGYKQYFHINRLCDWSKNSTAFIDERTGESSDNCTANLYIPRFNGHWYEAQLEYSEEYEEDGELYPAECKLFVALIQ